MAIDEPRRPFTRLEPYSYSRTLAQRLAGRRLVDPLRNLLTRFGLRHYEVRVIRIRWSGGVRGEGEPYLDQNLLLEPTPKIGGASLGALAESVEGVGVQELGQITVERISTAYDERYLRGLLPGEDRHPQDAEALWEVTFFGSAAPVRRRFNVATVPGRHTFGWTVVLERADGADRDPRTRDLALSKPTEDRL